MSRNTYAVETVARLELEALGPRPTTVHDRWLKTMLLSLRRKNKTGEVFTDEEVRAYRDAREDLIDVLSEPNP